MIRTMATHVMLCLILTHMFWNTMAQQNGGSALENFLSSIFNTINDGLSTEEPTSSPSKFPTSSPSWQPSLSPTMRPTLKPTSRPTLQPTSTPSRLSSSLPSIYPSILPTTNPSTQPSGVPSIVLSNRPSSMPSNLPFGKPSESPSLSPSTLPSMVPSKYPSNNPSREHSNSPSSSPSKSPSLTPSTLPSMVPSNYPSLTSSTLPSMAPSNYPSGESSRAPTSSPSRSPSRSPSLKPSTLPSMVQSVRPSSNPSQTPSNSPFIAPSESTFPKISPIAASSAAPTEVPSINQSSRTSLTLTEIPTLIPGSRVIAQLLIDLNPIQIELDDDDITNFEGTFLLQLNTNECHYDENSVDVLSVKVTSQNITQLEGQHTLVVDITVTGRAPPHAPNGNLWFETLIRKCFESNLSDLRYSLSQSSAIFTPLLSNDNEINDKKINFNKIVYFVAIGAGVFIIIALSFLIYAMKKMKPNSKAETDVEDDSISVLSAASLPPFQISSNSAASIISDASYIVSADSSSKRAVSSVGDESFTTNDITLQTLATKDITLQKLAFIPFNESQSVLSHSLHSKAALKKSIESSTLFNRLGIEDVKSQAHSTDESTTGCTLFKGLNAYCFTLFKGLDAELLEDEESQAPTTGESTNGSAYPLPGVNIPHQAVEEAKQLRKLNVRFDSNEDEKSQAHGADKSNNRGMFKLNTKHLNLELDEESRADTVGSSETGSIYPLPGVNISHQAVKDAMRLHKIQYSSAPIRSNDE